MQECAIDKLFIKRHDMIRACALQIHEKMHEVEFQRIQLDQMIS